MIGRSNENPRGGNRLAFWLVFGLVTLVLVGTSYWVLSFIANEVDDMEAEAAVMVDPNVASPIYVDFYTNVDNYVSAESYLAMGAYTQQYQMPQNVQVLTDLNSVEMIGYMMNHVSGGMRVDCTYCHSLQNFAADEWDDEEAMARKNLARQHLLLTRDLNRDWLTMLDDLTPDKNPSNAQMTCAICHNGVAQPITWGEDALEGLPQDLRLPLEADLSLDPDHVGILNVNARDVGLETVYYNQNVMYHMNSSMNVGCTHCHNSRWFPSWEVPAKYYSQHMLLMSQFIWQEYGDTFNGQEPSCTMCHQGAVIPPGAARSPAVLPDSLTAASTAP
jgi:photosynthetic reaction center cytochrome c subunit